MRTESGKRKVQQHAPLYSLSRTGQILIRKCATRSVEMNKNSIVMSQWKFIVMSLVVCLPKHVYIDKKKREKNQQKNVYIDVWASRW